LCQVAGTRHRRCDAGEHAAKVAPDAHRDVHDLVRGMPQVTVVHGPQGNPIYQVGGRSFVFFRTARPDATDPRTGRRVRVARVT
jgi:hypothetical protein